MKKCLGYVFAAALVMGTSAFAQDPNPPANQSKSKTSGSSETMQDTKTKTDSNTNKMSTDTVTGKVEAYDAGKSIKVSTPGSPEGSKTFDLSGSNLTAHVPANLKVGDTVSVKEKTDNNGHKTVTVSHSKHAARTGTN
jgi:hypothetical protein